MCGIGFGLMFQVAIAAIVLLVILAILRSAFPGVLDTSGPYGEIVRIVAWGVAAIVALYLLWRIASCAGLASF